MGPQVRSAIRTAWRSSSKTLFLVAVAAVVAGVMVWVSHGFGVWAPTPVRWSAQSSASPQQTYLADGQWAQRPLYRPGAVTLSADGSFILTNLTWSSWTTSDASAAGTGRVNDCEPTCVNGTYHNYPVQARLGTPEDVCGRRFFTAVTVTWTAQVPPGWPRSDTVKQVIQC